MYCGPHGGQLIGWIHNWKTTFGRESGDFAPGAFSAKITLKNIYQPGNFSYVCKHIFLAMQASFRLNPNMLGVIRVRKTSFSADFDHCRHAEDIYKILTVNTRVL